MRLFSFRYQFVKLLNFNVFDRLNFKNCYQKHEILHLIFHFRIKAFIVNVLNWILITTLRLIKMFKYLTPNLVFKTAFENDTK